MNDDKQKYIVGITGASGVVMGMRLVEALLSRHCEVHIVVTHAGQNVLQEELNIQQIQQRPNLYTHNINDITASIASGSVKTNGMIVIPCSMGTLASIANGISANLLQRAADVTIKERRKLILVPRETPLSSIHLKNMLTLSQNGAIILPPTPGFYIKPSTIDDLINFIVGKVLDQLNIDHDLYKRYRQ